MCMVARFRFQEFGQSFNQAFFRECWCCRKCCCASPMCDSEVVCCPRRCSSSVGRLLVDSRTGIRLIVGACISFYPQLVAKAGTTSSVVHVRIACEELLQLAGQVWWI